MNAGYPDSRAGERPHFHSESFAHSLSTAGRWPKIIGRDRVAWRVELLNGAINDIYFDTRYIIERERKAWVEKQNHILDAHPETVS